MRSIQEKLSNDGELDAVDLEPISAPAVSALKQKRLTLAWLDGEAQKVGFFSPISVLMSKFVDLG